MKKANITSAIGIGDILYLKASLDEIKHEYNEINIHFAMGLISWTNRNQDYSHFILQLGDLLFNDSPYKIVKEGPEFRPMMEVYSSYNIRPTKPNLPILCKGESLNIEPYIVLTTKIRYLHRNEFKDAELWNVLNQLPYKIVVLGEREVEMNNEYRHDNTYGPTVYSIYPDIINNLGSKVIDKTIPALGVTSPNIDQLRQDALIMSEARAMLTLGIGGNFTTGMAVAQKLIGYKPNNEFYADTIFSQDEQVGNSFVTRDWNSFLKKIGEI